MYCFQFKCPDWLILNWMTVWREMNVWTERFWIEWPLELKWLFWMIVIMKSVCHLKCYFEGHSMHCQVLEMSWFKCFDKRFWKYCASLRNVYESPASISDQGVVKTFTATILTWTILRNVQACLHDRLNDWLIMNDQLIKRMIEWSWVNEKVECNQ